MEEGRGLASSRSALRPPADGEYEPAAGRKPVGERGGEGQRRGRARGGSFQEKETLFGHYEEETDQGSSLQSSPRHSRCSFQRICGNPTDPSPFLPQPPSQFQKAAAPLQRGGGHGGLGVAACAPRFVLPLPLVLPLREAGSGGGDGEPGRDAPRTTRLDSSLH